MHVKNFIRNSKFCIKRNTQIHFGQPFRSLDIKVHSVIDSKTYAKDQPECHQTRIKNVQNSRYFHYNNFKRNRIPKTRLPIDFQPPARRFILFGSLICK